MHTDGVRSNRAGGNASVEGSKLPQVHEGFSEALGLPLKTADGELLFKPTHTRYYQTLGAEDPQANLNPSSSIPTMAAHCVLPYW